MEKVSKNLKRTIALLLSFIMISGQFTGMAAAIDVSDYTYTNIEPIFDVEYKYDTYVPHGEESYETVTTDISIPDDYTLYLSVNDWVAARYPAGSDIGWSGTHAIRNAGSRLVAGVDGAVTITDRTSQSSGAEVRVELYPNDLIVITGYVEESHPEDMQVWLQFPANGWHTHGINIASDGSFSEILTISEANAMGSDNFRITGSNAGTTVDINIRTLSIYRHDDAEPIEVPDYEFIDHNFPTLASEYLGDYILQVHIPTGNQWDGLRLNRNLLLDVLSEDGIYAYSFDLFSPQSPAGLGLMLQTNGPSWFHHLITPNFNPAAEGQWVRFHADLDFVGRPGLRNPYNVAAGEWTELQLVRRGSGSGGINDGDMTLFFIDNFTITNADGEIVWIADFEDGVNPFTGSPATVDMQIVPADRAGNVNLVIPEFDLTLPSLAERFADYFLFGNIWSNPAVMGNPITNEFFTQQFSAVTAENNHKPDHIAPTPNPDNWDFSIADEIVDWAEENELKMVGHTLVWHSQSPLWMTGREGSAQFPLVTRSEALANMELFISTYAGRYAGRMFSWDVLNEVFTDSVTEAAWEANPDWRAHLRREGVGLNQTGYLRWYDAFANGAEDYECGSDFIFYAFYFARKADPYAILYYNDFNEEQPGKSKAIAQMVVETNERWAQHPEYDGRLLVEVIGMQSHHHLDQWITNLDNIRPAMKRFIETGARISVTELDITIGTQVNPLPMPLPADQQARLAAAYARVMGYYLEFSDYMNRVSIWGLADTHSWRAWGQPLLFDGHYQAKDAFWAVYEAVANVPEDDYIPTPPELTEIKYEWLIGNTFKQGYNLDLQLKISSHVFAYFDGLYINGEAPAFAEHYLVEGPYIRITMLNMFLESLTVGTHELVIELADGQTLETYFIIEAADEITPPPPPPGPGDGEDEDLETDNGNDEDDEEHVDNDGDEEEGTDLPQTSVSTVANVSLLSGLVTILTTIGGIKVHRKKQSLKK